LEMTQSALSSKHWSHWRRKMRRNLMTVINLCSSLCNNVWRWLRTRCKSWMRVRAKRRGFPFK
jgi:hypothetical protein